MISPETAIQRERFPSIGEKTRPPERAAEQRSWARDAEARAADTRHPGRLWLGIAVAMPVALGFWALVWLAIAWTTGH
jgi:hypothetical protein